jgi:hypothetical protein
MLFIALFYMSSDVMVIDDAVFGVKQCQREENGEEDNNRAKKGRFIHSFIWSFFWDGYYGFPPPFSSILTSLTFLIFMLRHARQTQRHCS